MIDIAEALPLSTGATSKSRRRKSERVLNLTAAVAVAAAHIMASLKLLLVLTKNGKLVETSFPNP